MKTISKAEGPPCSGLPGKSQPGLIAHLFVQGEIQKIPEAEQSKMTMALKVDRDSKMGLLIDVQEKLQEVDKRKLLYNSFPNDSN